jgi:DNA-binding CsgD family transcriptional regulator
MAKRTYTVQKAQIIALSARAATTREIARITHLSQATVINLQKQLYADIENAKREYVEGARKKIEKDYDATMNEVAGNFQIALQRISKRLSKPSIINKLNGAQLSMSGGIITDKLRLIKGDPTDVIDHRFGDKQGTIGFIRGKQAVKPTPAPVSTEKSASNGEITKRGNAPTKK